jgi:D-hexose-6-phosphate mutarotase
MPICSEGEEQVNSANELQHKFGIASIVTVSEKAPGFPVIEVENQYAKATIALHGAHVMAFQPTGEQPVLWLSRDAMYVAGKAIRGGIPICWPWFGGHPTGNLQAHGFVRNRFWQLESVVQLANGFTRLIMSTGDDDISRALWDHRFRLSLTVVVGNDLSLALEMQNLDSVSYTLTAALHSYFNVADISKVDIWGLEGIEYIDQLRNNQRLMQSGAIRFDGELDRIYCSATADELIHDTRLKRKIRLRKTGSRSTVIWNPWIRKADSMGDFEKGGYRHMVCIETGNAADDIVQLAPNMSHELGVVISVERS